MMSSPSLPMLTTVPLFPNPVRTFFVVQFRSPTSQSHLPAPPNRLQPLRIRTRTSLYREMLDRSVSLDGSDTKLQRWYMFVWTGFICDFLLFSIFETHLLLTPATRFPPQHTQTRKFVGLFDIAEWISYRAAWLVDVCHS